MEFGFPQYSDDVANPIDKLKDTRDRRILNTTALFFESVRLATFYYFKYREELDVKKMAKKGFYYSRLTDSVVCYFCNEKIQFGGNYEEETSSHAIDEDEKCPMARFPLNGNVPIIDPHSVDNDSYSKLNWMLQDFMAHNVRNDIPNKGKKIIFNPNIVKEDALKETFVLGTNRLSTFDQFLKYLPEEIRPKKNRYAEAGFVYTGFSDIVMCFECKGGLFNLHVEDDPIKDHATFFGHCPFIKEYVEKHKVDVKLQYQNVLKPFKEQDKKLLMHHPMVKNLLFQGYKKSDIKNIVEKHVELFGHFPFDIRIFKKEM
ncbi:Death-associated inhibitor of apoptosis 1 [Armadillidium nasatum]|uniref:Death-associated inhibitor of apoptosis 1 n=1 Tax=Armadillidium nasatum TaxID=96803 RepID=A0A5N5TJD4_9CRUS|nr:Death-associated inhibitor of apoptosis 1 [Armadillidium nasatum]